MAKQRRKSSCPEPLNTMIDIAGAVTMGIVSRSMVQKDIKRGQGRESVAVAREIFGAGALRGGSDGLISLGGLMGVESAVRSAEREGQQNCAYTEEDALIADLERRINKTQVHHSTMEAPVPPVSPTKPEHEPVPQAVNDITPEKETYIFCRVSRLDNGNNEYYLAAHDYVIGSKVEIETDNGFAHGIVLTVERHQRATAPIDPGMAKRIME